MTQEDANFQQKQLANWLALGTAIAGNILDAGLRSCVTVDPDVADDAFASNFSQITGIPADKVVGRPVTKVAERMLTFATESPANLAMVCAMATSMLMVANHMPHGPRIHQRRKRGK